MKKSIAILGATGSIGTQALEVIAAHPDFFEIDTLTAQNNVTLLAQQAIQYLPNNVVITNESKYNELKALLAPYPIKVFAGHEALAQVVTFNSVDTVLTALVGFSGLLPTIAALKAGKKIALANKETLVVAGQLVKALVTQNNTVVLPVDSEHSAIFQCLVGEPAATVEKLILTASGGPFRGKSKQALEHITVAQALKHPNWSMGSKITIDSATLMNKGLEVIEAHWLFGIEANKIDVLVHPQSIIHSMVQFVDGSIKAQLGLPDMKLPIQYALTYPDRFQNDFKRMDFKNYPSLTFENPDLETFRCLKLAYQALENSGNAPCILNAANEIAVDAFLKEKIRFLAIPDMIEASLNHIKQISTPTVEELLETDHETRIFASTLI